VGARHSTAAVHPQEPSDVKPWLFASSAALLILLIAVVLMVRLGLFQNSSTDVGTKNIASALALVGAVLSAAVTLIGTVVKFSIDDRTARLAAIEQQRNYALAQEAEKRNRIEAAIRAVGLLAQNNKDAPSSQIDGALLALVSLDEIDLALALLSELWKKEKVSQHAAEVILRQAFVSGDDDARTAAADILGQNADQLSSQEYYFWPVPSSGWRADFPPNVRFSMVYAAAQWLESQLTMDVKRGVHLRLPEASAPLYEALKDENEDVVGIAAAALRPLMKRLHGGYWTYLNGTLIKAEAIRAKLKEAKVTHTSVSDELSTKIEEILAKSHGPQKQA
jgi:hypothetical protein